jgi:hypothetical protein
MGNPKQRNIRRGGRPQKAGPRYPSGDLKPQVIVPPEALRQRAELLGIDPVKMISMTEAVARIIGDEKAGTALGRLTWKFAADGQRERRQGEFGGTGSDGKPISEAWITDEMVDSADAYRALWVHWHRVTGMPRRNPAGQQFARADKGHNGVEHVACERPANPRCRCDICRTADRLRVAERALKSCDQHVLVWRVTECVVIEDIAPDSLVMGERSAALAALRRGLLALHGALCAGRRRAA